MRSTRQPSEGKWALIGWPVSWVTGLVVPGNNQGSLNDCLFNLMRPWLHHDLDSIIIVWPLSCSFHRMDSFHVQWQSQSLFFLWYLLEDDIVIMWRIGLLMAPYIIVLSHVAIVILSYTNCHLCTTRYSFIPEWSETLEGKVPYPRTQHAYNNVQQFYVQWQSKSLFFSVVYAGI